MVPAAVATGMQRCGRSTNDAHQHFQDLKASHVADWDDLPSWQQDTDADIFERIELQAGARSWLSCPRLGSAMSSSPSSTSRRR